jgi:hypothetical protein
MFAFQTLSGQFEVPVVDQKPESARTAVGAYLGVDARRVVLIPPHELRSYHAGVVVQLPFEVEHHPTSPTYRSPARLVQLYEQNLPYLRMHKYDISANAGATELLMRYPDRIDLDGLVHNPHPAAVEYVRNARGERAWDMELVNGGAVAYLAPAVSALTHDSYLGRLMLSDNRHAGCLWYEYPEAIDWTVLSQNESDDALDLLLTHPERIDWASFACNRSPRAIEYMRDHVEFVNWTHLSSNPMAVDLLLAHLDKVDWSYLCLNPSPSIITLLSYHLDRINWTLLSSNRSAASLLRLRPDLIDFASLSAMRGNVDLLMEYVDRLDPRVLSSNPNAVDVLCARPDLIDWKLLCRPWPWLERVE